MKIPITQSKDWQNLQDALGERSFFHQEKNYQYLAIFKSVPGGNYLYLPYGPVAKDKSAFQDALKSLIQLARQQNVIFIRIEPLNPVSAKNLPLSAKKTKDLNPKETWLLDLTGNEADLIAKLPSRLMRYYKQAAKKGITIDTSHNPDDIHYLLDLQKALAKEKGINTFSEEYLRTELAQPFSTLYLVRQCPPEDALQAGRAPRRVVLPEGVPRPQSCEDGGGGNDRTRREPATNNVLAAGLVFDDKTTRYNLQGAQSEQGRKLHATGILTIQLILDAKEKGLKTFDFWGIAPENAPDDHPWAGFTAFKKTFAGYEENHAGTYDLILRPFKYKVYQIMRKLNRLIRK